MDKDVKTTLLEDDEFVKLIENEVAAENETDSLAQKRVWQRLEKSRRKTYRPQWIAAASLILGLAAGAFFLGPGRDHDLKSGGSVSNASGILALSMKDATLEIRLQDAGHVQHLAIIRDGSPFTILWQGPVENWIQPLVTPRSGPDRVCLLEAATADELSHGLKIMNELKQVPDDLPCWEL